MKQLFKIHRPSGSPYIVWENGDIERTDMKFTPSGNWKFLGLSHVKQNWFIPLKDITPELLSTLPLRWKNGNPQFTGRDLDHGTTREWGNTKYYGISSIEFIKQ